MIHPLQMTRGHCTMVLTMGRLMQFERWTSDERDQEVIEAESGEGEEETILKMFCKSKINI